MSKGERHAIPNAVWLVFQVLNPLKTNDIFFIIYLYVKYLDHKLRYENLRSKLIKLNVSIGSIKAVLQFYLLILVSETFNLIAYTFHPWILYLSNIAKQPNIHFVNWMTKFVLEIFCRVSTFVSQVFGFIVSILQN